MAKVSSLTAAYAKRRKETVESGDYERYGTYTYHRPENEEGSQEKLEALAEEVSARNEEKKRNNPAVSFAGLQDMRPSYMRQQAQPAVPQSQVSMNSLLQTGQRGGNQERNEVRAQSFNDYTSAVRRARADADGFQQAVERGRGMTHNGLDADLDYKDALGITSRKDKRTTAMGALTWRTPESEAKTNSMLSDREKQNYYYLAATQGRQEAENYRQYLLEKNKINEQLGQERYEKVKDASLPTKAVTAFTASMAGATEQTANVGNAMLGRASIKATTPAEHLAQAIEQGENDTSTIRGRVAHKAIQLANTAGTNMPSMVAGAVFTPGVGSAMFATQAAGAAYQEVINNGGTVQQAQEYAALQAVDEEITNALLGGIAERGGGMLKNMLKDTALARNLHGVLRGAFTNNPVGLHVAEGFINALADGGSEAAQEYVQYFTERFERWLATGEAPTYNVNGEQKTYEQLVAELGQQGAIEAIAGNPEAIESALMGFLNAELMGGVRGAGNTLNTLQMGSLASPDAYAGLADSVNPNVLQYRSEDTYRKGREVQNYARDQIRRAEAGRENSLSSVYGRGLMLQAAQEYADAVAETEMDDMSSEDALRQAAEERLANARPDHENAIDRTNRIRAALRGDNAQAAWDTVEDTSGRHEFVIPADTREQAASDLLESQDADRVSWNTEQGEVALDRESDGSYTFTNERGESVTMDAAQAVDLIPAGQNITVQGAAAETAPSTEAEAPSTVPSTETTAPTTETTASSTAAVQTAAENVTKTAPVTYREKMQEAIRNNPNSQRLANERAVRASQDLSTHFGEAGQKLFKQMDPKTAVQNYRAFSQVYNYARFGGTMELSNEASMILGPEATAAAIRAGNEDANTAFPEQTVSSVRNAVSKVRTTGTAGRVTFAKGAEYKNLTNQQKLRADYAGALITKVLGMDVHFVQSSTKDGKYQGMNGSYSRVNGRPTITLDVNAGMNMESDWTGEVTDIKTMLPVISHELTHWMEKSHPDLYREIQNAVISTLANDSKYTKGLTINSVIAAERQRLNETVRDENGNPVQHTNEDAIHELVARACEEMLSGSKQAAQAFENLDAESKNTLWNHIKEVFNSIREFFEEMLGSYRSNSLEAKAIRRNMEEFEKIRDIWQQALNGGEYAVNPDITSTEFHDGIGENGINISSDSVQQMSERTYEEGGRKYLDNWLKRQVKSNKITEQDRTDIMRALDEMKRIMEDIRTEEGAEVDAYSRWADTRAKEDRYKDDSGKWQKAFTAIVNNGEYKMNIDFSTVCKKRTALNSVLNAMVTSGDLNFETLTASEVVELNNIIKEEGFEIACALCFVDSKRYRIGSWAESFCEGSGKDGKAEDRRYGWNEIVRSMVPEGSGLNIADFNFTNRAIENNDTNLLSDYKGKVDMTLINEIKKNFGKTTEAYRMADTLQKNPSMRKLLAPAEMISSAGLDLIKAQNKTLFKLINSHQGTAKPKLAFDNVAYNNDILKTQWTPGAALKVGGVRLQSFSDFQANMVFDYVQMVGEMQAKGLSCHSYTKEASFVAIFGKTGIKINMSLVPKSTTYTAEQVAKMSDSMREKLKATAGLDKDGNYIWEDETFPYEVAMHIQEDPEYAKNCGTIAVGVSDPHIRKLLADPRIQMVIPYHKSSINHVVAALRNIALYNDYTDFQNTRTLDGKKLDGVPDFDFYAYMYGIGDSVKATKKDGSYDASGTNANIRKLHENWKNGKIYDGKTVANAYLDWCEKKGEFANREGEVYLPRFDQFAYNEDGTRNENYYKLLADFRLYDENGNPAPQQAVQSVYPDNVKDLIVNGYKFQDGKYHYENGGLKNATQVRDDLTRKTPEIIKRFKDFRERGYSEGEIAIMQQAGRTEVAVEERMEEIRNSRAQMSLREDYDESSPSMISDSGVQYSHRITDEDTLDRLNKEVENGDYIVTYKAMQKIGDELYPPMAAKVKGKDGKYRMQNPSMLNVWQEADEDTSHIKFKKNQDYGYYVLNKGDGSSVEAAYNPYEHSSNLVLNDQFEGAYKRDNLVVVKCIIPKSEIYGENRYKAQYAKDSTGVLDWKSGVVAGQLKDNKRQVYLSRYLMPVEIVPTDEVARMWKDTLKGSNVVVPFNVVQPSLLKELEKVGIPIDYDGSPIYKAHHKNSNQQYSMRDSEYMSAVESNDTETADRLVKEAADAAGYKLSVYHGTGEHFTVFNMGNEGIHLGNRQQAEQVAKTRFENRSKTSMYVWEKIRSRVPEMDREQRDSLVSAAYGLGDYFDAGVDESWFDGDIMDDAAVTAYVNHMVDAYKNGTGRDDDVTLRMRTFDRETNENVMELYAKINNPMVINGDIVSWTPEDIARVIFARNAGNDEFESWYRNNPVDISGSEISLSEDDKKDLEAIKRTTDEEGWPILRDLLARQGFDGIQYKNEYEGDKSSWSYIALSPSDVKSADTVTYDDNGNVIPLSERFNSDDSDIRYSMRDSAGNELTEAQAEYFKDSKARDENGNLLTLYHGTGSSGFTEFKIKPERGLWLTTSKRDADSYAGNIEGKLFDPNEAKSKGRSIGGSARIGKHLRFENDADMEQFLKENPDAKEYLSDRELMDKRYALDDLGWDELEEGEEEYNRLEKINRSVDIAYARYEMSHSQKIPLSEMLEHPERYSLNDIKRAWTDYDRYAYFDDEYDYSSDDEFKQVLVDRLKEAIEERAEVNGPEWREGMLNMKFYARIPEGMSGEIVTRKNRTYALYANVVNPYVFDNEGRGSEGNGRFYHTIEKAMADPQYDGVIVENARVGRYQDLGTVVLVKNPNQVKLTSNQNPTENPDLRYSQRNVDIDKRIDELVKKYGAIPKGEKPARNVDVPMQTSDNKNTRRFVRTILESGITSADLDDNIKSAILNESLSYEVATDKDAAEYAASVIRIGGIERAQREWDKARRSDTFNKDHMALGQFLLKEYAKNNDIDNAMNMIQDLAAEGTRMGQNIQAMRMLKKYAQQVPAIGLGYIQRTVDQMNREAKAKMGKRYKEMKIAPNLATEYINAQTRDEIDAALGKIYKNLGSQVQKTVPEEIIDHLRTWRYMSMLGNPRTHIRNLVGNALFVPAVTLKNAIGTGLEGTMKVSERTKSMSVSKQAMEFAKKDADEMKDVLSGESEKSIRDLIMDQRKVYKFEPLNKASKGNSAALEAEDWIFLRWHYQNALAQYITANNLDTTVQNPSWLGRARRYAVQEAQKATYRDANKVSTWLNQSKGAGAVVKYMMEGLMPFKKTPTNILRRGIEYSPAGLVRTMSKGIYDLNTGKMSVNEWIDALSSGLSGTAIFGLGMFLASTGAILGGYKDDDDKELRKLKGLQEYSVQIGNHTYTIDWAAPGSLPLFIGVETMNALRQERGMTMDDMGKAAARLIDPMINMSMLSGLNDTLDAISYADDKLSAATMEMFYSLLGQYVPTLFGQVARTIDTTQRINYQDVNTGMSKNMLYFIEKMQNKIPFLTFSNDPYLNEFGQENSGTPHWAAALQNFVSPGYISEIKDDRVIDEVARLNEAQDAEKVLPKKMPKYLGTKEDRVDLTSAQYHTFQKTAGQTAYNIIDNMIDDSRYSKMTAEKQANAIKMAYDYSKAVGRIAVQPEYEGKLTGDEKKIYEAVQSGSQAYDAILTLNTAKEIKQDVTYDKSAGETQKGATLDEIMSSNISQEEKGKAYAALYPSEGLTNWTKSGGSSYDYMMGQRLADDIPDGEESYQFVYSSSKYTKQQKSAWLQSQKRIVNSDGYKLWKKANGLDMDFIKYKADLKKFKGKGKKQKTLNYINSQTTNEAKRKALRKMAGY